MVFCCSVKRGESEGETLEINIRKSHSLKYLRHDFSLRECLHRSRQIGISLGIAADDFSDGRHEEMTIEMEKLAHGETRRAGEFDDDEPSARSKHAEKLRESAFEVGKVAYAIGHSGSIEMIVGEIELHAIVFFKTQPCYVFGFAACYLEHTF